MGDNDLTSSLVVGQLLRYIAWVKKHHADPGQKVRGMIVAKTITEDLVLACEEVPSVTLYEYSLSIQVKKVNTASESS